MRIAMVTQSYYPQLGGVTEHVHWLSRALRLAGHDVVIITGGPSIPNERSVIRLGGNAVFPMNGAMVNVTVGFRLRRRLARVFDQGRFDLIHIQSPLEPTLPLAALVAAESTSVPVVGTFHMCARRSSAYDLFARVLERHASRLDFRIAVSEAAKSFAARYFPGDYAVIPNGIDFDRFANPSGEPGITEDGRVNLLFVGRLDVRKRVPSLISAFKQVNARIRDARLVIIGTGLTGLVSRVTALPLWGRAVVFRGSVDPEVLPDYYAASDIFCSVPSGSESFGIVLLEAMAAGKPVIASDIAGYREIVTHGSEGVLVRPGDKQALVEAMTWLAEDRRARETMGRLGRQKARRYDWKLITEKIESVYGRLTHPPVTAAP
jgi:phosphatidylinositol alpha-mannosyltransferase